MFELEKIKIMNNLTFIDFCAGIGAGRLGLQMNGLKPIAYSEINNHSEKTYKILFGDKEQNLGDLTKINIDALPNFNLMIGGFPCQTFSIVGKRQGFHDRRGQIIFSLLKILDDKSVPYFIFENVKGLINHDKGITFKKIINEISNKKYKVFWKVLNSKDYGVPHSRERVYIVGFKKELKVKNFEWPKKKKCRHLSKFLQPNKENLFDKNNATFQKYLLNKYNSHKFNLDKILRKNYLILDCRQSDLRIYESVIPTLRAGRHGILYTYNDNLYKLSGYESLLLQGFPSKLAIKTSNVSENKLLLQSGNAMTVTVIYEICKMLLKSINR